MANRRGRKPKNVRENVASSDPRIKQQEASRRYRRNVSYRKEQTLNEICRNEDRNGCLRTLINEATYLKSLYQNPLNQNYSENGNTVNQPQDNETTQSLEGQTAETYQLQIDEIEFSDHNLSGSLENQSYEAIGTPLNVSAFNADMDRSKENSQIIGDLFTETPLEDLVKTITNYGVDSNIQLALDESSKVFYDYPGSPLNCFDLNNLLIPTPSKDVNKAITDDYNNFNYQNDLNVNTQLAFDESSKVLYDYHISTLNNFNLNHNSSLDESQYQKINFNANTTLQNNYMDTLDYIKKQELFDPIDYIDINIINPIDTL
jgi:hypothetical protein